MKLKNEPVAVGGSITGLLSAVLAALVAFGVWSPTEAQTAALFGIVAAVTAVVTPLVRRKTYGPVTVAEAMKPSPEVILPGGVGPAAVVPPEG